MKKIGIYKIENLISGKVYIGQSTNIQHRCNSHKLELKKGKHFCKLLQKDWNTYGEENFSFLIIEECEKEKLNDREIYWIKTYGGVNSSNVYNEQSGGTITFTYSLAARKRQSIRQKGKELTWWKDLNRQDPIYRQRLSEALKGKKKSALHFSYLLKSTPLTYNL